MAEGEPGARIKGGLMMAGRKSIKHDLREVDMADVLESLSPAAREVLTRRFLATDWYSLEAVDEIIRAVARHVGKTPEEYALQLGRGSAHQSAGRLAWTLVTLFGSPERLASYTPRYWSRLYDGGDVTASYDASAGQLTMTVRNWLGHSALRCFNPLGTIVQLSEQFKAPTLVKFKQVACVTRGDRECVYHLHYRK